VRAKNYGCIEDIGIELASRLTSASMERRFLLGIKQPPLSSTGCGVTFTPGLTGKNMPDGDEHRRVDRPQDNPLMPKKRWPVAA
jgi:hypothetical protein